MRYGMGETLMTPLSAGPSLATAADLAESRRQIAQNNIYTMIGVGVSALTILYVENGWIYVAAGWLLFMRAALGGIS